MRTRKWTWRTRTTKAKRYAVIRAAIAALWERPHRPAWFAPEEPRFRFMTPGSRWLGKQTLCDPK